MKDDIGDFEGFISSQVECVVEDMIRSYLDDTSPANTKQMYHHEALPPSRPLRAVSQDRHVNMEVADSLSFEDIEEERPKVKQAKGLTKETLEKDNEIEDPEHEAISPDNEEATFDDLFGSAVSPVDSDEEGTIEDSPVFNIPVLPPTPTPRPYAKKIPRLKVKVTECTSAHDSEGA